MLPGTGPGNAIEGGKITVTGAFGGGICTTSTTLFNAAFRAGMIPIARQNHNEYITRYPAGLDATVWIIGKTKQTMSFRNDTKYPILIQRAITGNGSKRWLTFKIWSVPNHRTSKISNTVIKHGPSARSQDRAGSEQAGGVPLLQQRPGGRRQGVDHRVDLRPRQAPLVEALLLGLPGGQRRHRRGDRLTPACSARPRPGRRRAPMTDPEAQQRQATTLELRTAMAGKASDAKTADGDGPAFAYIASLPQPQRGSPNRSMPWRRGHAPSGAR